MRKERLLGISTERWPYLVNESEDEGEDGTVPGRESEIARYKNGIVPRGSLGSERDVEMGGGRGTIMSAGKSWREIMERMRMINFNDFQEGLNVILIVVGVLVVGGGVVALLLVLA